MEQARSLKTGVKYKNTPIGKIPVDWELVKLKDVCDEIYRYPTYYNIKYVEQEQGVPEIRGELIKANGELSNDMSVYRYISKETSSRFSKTILHEGDFVLSVRGTMGKIGYIPSRLENANMTANLMRMSPNREKTYPLWLKQFFLSDFFQKCLDDASSATTIKTIKAPELKSIELALPPISEQKKITEILTTVDEAIEKTAHIIEKTKEVKKGLMQELLKKGTILGFMLETTVFGDIIDKKIDIEKLPKRFKYFITHVQLDELNNTNEEGRKKKLLKVFELIDKKEIPTESFVLGYSRLRQAKLGEGNIFENLRKENLKHTEDALIAETAIENNLTLISNDITLLKKVRALGGNSITLEDFLNGNYREYLQTEIGMIPKEWNVVRLKDIAANQKHSFVDGPFGSNLKSIHYVDQGVPVIQSQSIISGIYKPTGNIYVSEQKANELERSKVLPGDIVIAKIGVNYGASATIPQNHPVAVLSGNTMKITPNPNEVITEFLQYLLHYFRSIKLFDKIVSTTAQPAITLEGTKKIKIPLPSLSEQKKIAEILSSVDEEIERETWHKNQLDSLKKGLMQVLLTGKIRVKV